MAARKRKRRRRQGSWTLVGLGSAAVVAGVYAVGRRERSPRPHIAARPALPAPRRLAGPAGDLAVLDGGDEGLPVVFVHGLAGAAAHWREQLLHLWPRRRALAIDLRGHGGSSPAPDGGYRIADLAADVAAVVDALELDRFALVGHSLGALVTCRYAADHPERVAGLLLADPNGDQSRLPREQVRAFLAAVRADPGGELRFNFRHILAGARPQVAERVLADLAATGDEVLVGALESAAAASPVADLERYGGPALTVVSPFNSLPVSLHNLLPALPVRRLRGTSHWLMMDAPEEFNRLLDAFLGRLS
jgi:pimeloyl-ACP methyl ester carboxylesterase